MRTRWRPLLLVLVAVACSSGGGGRSSTPDPSSSQGILAAAPAKTIDAGSARIAVKAAVRGQTRGTFAGEGAFAFPSSQGRLELDLGPLGLAGAGNTEVLFDGDVVYLKLGGALPGLGQKPWVRIDLGTIKKGQGDGIEALRQLRANDPRAVINELRGVTGDAKRLGTEVIRGTATTHYRTTVDLDTAAAASPAHVRGNLSEVARQMGTSKLPVEAWLDGEGRLRRLRYTIDLANLDENAPAKRSGAGTGTVVATLELYEFGVKVTASPPPADQVTDLAKLLGGAK